MTQHSGSSVASEWQPGDPVFSPPAPDTCTSCGEHKPGEMAVHSGNTHWCADCLAEAVPDADR
jgi:hypothetical protein